MQAQQPGSALGPALPTEMPSAAEMAPAKTPAARKAAKVKPSPAPAIPRSAAPTPSVTPGFNPDAVSHIPRPFSPRPADGSTPPENIPAPEPLALPAVPPAIPRTLPVTSRKVLFRIGYLRPEESSPLSATWAQELKSALEKDTAFAKAARDTDIIGVSLRPCDGAADMQQRLAQEEFDMVFCPAMVYAQEKILLDRTGDPARYHVVFQCRPSGARPGEKVMHRGVLFARRGVVPGDATKKVPPSELKLVLKSATVAVAGSYDAAGFFYVRRMLWEDFEHCEPGEYLFLGTPQEAVKAVISGICDYGACEEDVLKEVLGTIPGNAGDTASLARVLGETKWVPTDPVLLHEQYGPAKSGKPDAGRAAAEVARAFFNARAGQPGGSFSLEPGDEAAYDKMVQDLTRARESRKE